MKAVIAILALLAAAPAAHARPFKDLCDQFEPLRRLAGLKYVKPRVLIQPREGVKPQDVVFTIEAKSGPIRISPGPEGDITLPFSDALCAENPNMEMNQPPGTVNIAISIDPKVPPAQTLDYRLLDDLRREWSEAISRQSLMWRLLAPNPKGYQIVFAPGAVAAAEIRLVSGVRKLAANEKGVVRIPFEDSWIAANPTIVLTELPRRIGLAFD